MGTPQIREKRHRPVRTTVAVSRYIPLFWRIFIPNATVLGVAGLVLLAEPANGKALVLVAGLVMMLVINLLIMRRTLQPLEELTQLMHDLDPLEPGQRLEVPGPESEVTELTRSFNDMLERLEDERRDSARRELAAHQGLRRHVARELHDELGQDLTALALQLDRMANGGAPDVRASAAEARDTALEAVEALRDIARQLRPEILDDLGLRPAVEDLSARLSERTGLPIDVHWEGPPNGLDPDASLVVFRVIQESLTNVVRHSGASRASVTTRAGGGALVTTIEDDGVGIGRDAPIHLGGLRQMRERALLVGASLSLGPGPRGGTRVELRVPEETR